MSVSMGYSFLPSMFNTLQVQRIGLGLRGDTMSKKLGRCSGCRQPLVAGHIHPMGGGRVCDDCYPYIRTETGGLMYKSAVGKPRLGVQKLQDMLSGVVKHEQI